MVGNTPSWLWGSSYDWHPYYTRWPTWVYCGGKRHWLVGRRRLVWRRTVMRRRQVGKWEYAEPFLILLQE